MVPGGKAQLGQACKVKRRVWETTNYGSHFTCEETEALRSLGDFLRVVQLASGSPKT